MVEYVQKFGLTKPGEELIHKLVDKNMIIDLSHSNEKTFFDIKNICNTVSGKIILLEIAILLSIFLSGKIFNFPCNQIKKYSKK